MNWNSTLGKFVISVGFAVATVVVAKALSFLAVNPNIYSPTTVLLLNAVLFGVKNFLDKETPNI